MKCVHSQRHRSRLQRHVTYKVYETLPRRGGGTGRRGGRGSEARHTTTLQLIGILMNNKLASFARARERARGIDGSRDGSIAGHDSAAATLSLILLFTMPLISVGFCSRVRPRSLPNAVTLQGSLISSGAARGTLSFLVGRLRAGANALLAAAWPVGVEKKVFLSDVGLIR